MPFVRQVVVASALCVHRTSSADSGSGEIASCQLAVMVKSLCSVAAKLRQQYIFRSYNRQCTTSTSTTTTRVIGRLGDIEHAKASYWHFSSKPYAGNILTAEVIPEAPRPRLNVEGMALEADVVDGGLRSCVSEWMSLHQASYFTL
ncbi:hypothetical protein O3P69_006827 [Scylla paramamosain]|uniref:Uncharacterized protein n=1 Tax=Scylla paramamosain TaxID=85552 RepID=A0AAW0U4R2_SCYPA